MLHIPNLLLKNIFFFFAVYKNEWKKHEFLRQKNKKSKFYKNKKQPVQMALTLIKYWNHMAQRI